MAEQSGPERVLLHLRILSPAVGGKFLVALTSTILETIFQTELDAQSAVVQSSYASIPENFKLDALMLPAVSKKLIAERTDFTVVNARSGSYELLAAVAGYVLAAFTNPLAVIANRAVDTSRAAAELEKYLRERIDHYVDRLLARASETFPRSVATHSKVEWNVQCTKVGSTVIVLLAPATSDGKSASDGPEPGGEADLLAIARHNWRVGLMVPRQDREPVAHPFA